MKEYGLFDIIGPIMIGPSSSHTAGAARLGKIANRMAMGHIQKADVTLYGSFSKTGRGHGTDRAIVAGILGMEPDDERLPISFEIAKEEGIDISIQFSEQNLRHPNTARIDMIDGKGNRLSMTGASLGGGAIEVQAIDGMEVSFGCDYPTLLVFHRDRPGLISQVTTLMAYRNINIAFMRVFRSSKDQRACMVIETDDPIPHTLVEHIEEHPEVLGVCSL